MTKNCNTFWCLHNDCFNSCKSFHTTFGLQSHLKDIHNVNLNYNTIVNNDNNKKTIWCLHADCIISYKTFKTQYGLLCHLKDIHNENYENYYKK